MSGPSHSNQVVITYKSRDDSLDPDEERREWKETSGTLNRTNGRVPDQGRHTEDPGVEVRKFPVLQLLPPFPGDVIGRNTPGFWERF